MHFSILIQVFIHLYCKDLQIFIYLNYSWYNKAKAIDQQNIKQFEDTLKLYIFSISGSKK